MRFTALRPDTIWHNPPQQSSPAPIYFIASVWIRGNEECIIFYTFLVFNTRKVCHYLCQKVYQSIFEVSISIFKKYMKYVNIFKKKINIYRKKYNNIQNMYIGIQKSVLSISIFLRSISIYQNDLNSAIFRKKTTEFSITIWG